MRLSAVTCESCGGSLQVGEGISTTTCPHCGSDMTLATTALTYPNPTPLRLGMKANIFGKQFELTGRIVFHERDDEDEYEWHEFALTAADGEVVYVEYDDGDWALLRPFTPTEPVDLRGGTLGLHQALMIDGTRAIINDRGQATVRHVEGELTWKAKVGDRAEYIDAKTPARSYSIEWTADEIEYFRGQPVSFKQVVKFFGLPEELATRQEGQKAAKKFARTAGQLAAVSAVF